MLILVARNITSQDVATDGVVNLGSVYRKYCKCIDGVKTFDFSATSVALQAQGVYEINVEITFTGDAAGVATFELTQNGEELLGATASETITTADTEVRSVSLLGYSLVDTTCLLGRLTNLIQNISVVNTGIAVNVTNIVISVKKVV